MDLISSPSKQPKTFASDTAINTKTCVTCSNVPESLFDPSAAKKHFSKFGKVIRIRMFPKKQTCIIEYDHVSSVDRAVLNAGAYDGFMFNVTRTKLRVRRKSKKEDDPDWVPDSDVEEELSAMSGTPVYRVSRQKPMDIENSAFERSKHKARPQTSKNSPIRKSNFVREKPPSSATSSGIESPVTVTTQTSLSTAEAALELHQLRSKISLTPDEQWRTLDARDKILRAWGGTGSRVKAGGATIGTCPDMCPEKERLHRQAEHQVMTLETVEQSDGQLDPLRAVKQYSRSSADQETPMCYELRPPSTLALTGAYLLRHVADTTRQVTLADWFHFMWDRFRGIRKDITQQALCCSDSIRLVEQCARFHAHCSARLADLEHTQFDQKLNTDNLTKCLQTLKHMYADAAPQDKPREAEFRGYVALLNLGDANFWWEIKQLPTEIQKSSEIVFAIKIFNALDNNNYVRFFRLIKEQANYLQSCILLRYFNDVRARALARIVKAFAPRGGSRYPASELMNTLGFESVENMKEFVTHYGLRFSKNDESELTVILDRNQFYEDTDPFPIGRAIKLIESKRTTSVGQVIAGGQIPECAERREVYSSFNKDGTFREAALLAEDLNYNTLNDTNRDIKALKAEVQRLMKSGGKTSYNAVKNTNEIKMNATSNAEIKSVTFNNSANKLFSFTPAIPIAAKEIAKLTPEKISEVEAKKMFSFSKPQEQFASSSTSGNAFKPASAGKSLFQVEQKGTQGGLFAKVNNENKDPFKKAQFETNTKIDDNNLFKKPNAPGATIFSQGLKTGNLFAQKVDNVFGKKEESNSVVKATGNNIFNKGDGLFTKTGSTLNFEKGGTVFAKPTVSEDDLKNPASIFGSFDKSKIFQGKTQPVFGTTDNKSQSFLANGDAKQTATSPGSLFKSAVNAPKESESKSYSIFNSKIKTSTAENISNSVNFTNKESVYDFNENDDESKTQLENQLREAKKLREEEDRKRLEQLRKEEELKQELQRQEERRQEEARKKAEELKKLEEQRKQEQIKKKIEEEKKAEIKKKAEEEQKFKERVDRESTEIIHELINEITQEIVTRDVKEENDNFRSLISFADSVTEELITDVCEEVCRSESKAESFLTRKLRKKWFNVWKRQVLKNLHKRVLLEDTPVWLTDQTPIEKATYLRRLYEKEALKQMNAFHRGYRFKGELNSLPSPNAYNLIEIIRSPLLKRMKQIYYPYDKCFFWKLSLISPGPNHWLCRKIEIERWILDAFSDKKKHDASDTLIHVGKYSWNNLMDFAISVSVTNNETKCNEALEGTNAMLIFATENDQNLIDSIQKKIKHKYPYHRIPVAIVTPLKNDTNEHDNLVAVLTECLDSKIISAFKIFSIDTNSVFHSLDQNTKSAMKWLAKKCPPNPPLEIDYLKSICQQYLGYEIWYRLKFDPDLRVHAILKDLKKLILCYNSAVDKLIETITNEDLFNYQSFPLELKVFLDDATPYPKPYEFIPSSVKTSENTSTIRNIMLKLKLPPPSTKFNPEDVPVMQDQIRSYCKEIGWFENPEEVVCKVVATLPSQLSDVSIPREEFVTNFEQYDLIDILNIIVYEKIKRLNNFDNRFVIYEKAALEEYRNIDWLYQIDVLTSIKHKAPESDEDVLDTFIKAKRRKLELDSLEYLMIEDKDCTMVEENINETNEDILKYSNCKQVVKQLEEQIELERMKSMELEKLLRNALLDG